MIVIFFKQKLMRMSSLLTISYLNSKANSVIQSVMPKRAYKKIKPLKTGRKLISWFCPEIIDKPLNTKQTLARQIFRFIFAIIVIASAAIANSFLLTKHISVNNIDELFTEFYQFSITLVETTSIVVTFKLGPKLPSLFQNLDNIYNACKYLIKILAVKTHLN